MDVEEYIKSECDRQHVTNYDDFRAAYEYALANPVNEILYLEVFVQDLAKRVEPEINRFYSNDTVMINIRYSEVSFLHGGKASKAGDVLYQFNRWVGIVENTGLDAEIIEDVVKALLQIHPWADGNGRTASIFRNWLLGSLCNPTPLPYYFGENK